MMDDVSSSLRERVFFAARDGMSLTLYALLYEKNTDEIDDLLNSVSTTSPGITKPGSYGIVLLMSSLRFLMIILFITFKSLCYLLRAILNVCVIKLFFVEWFYGPTQKE